MANIIEAEKKLALQPETRYPDTNFYQGSEAPCRFEGEVYNCVVRGEIPAQIDGTYYRCMPDPAWAPLYDDDVFINGDGAIDAIRFANGHADFKQKFVRTEKFQIERAARQSVFGRYRNRYTDDPRVKHKIHSTANTHVVYFEKQLLALKEDSKPYAMDPDTLETKGYYDFHGQYSAPTHTAHPKVDATTGEYMTMGYQAKGDGSTDVVYCCFDKNGKKLEECWVNAPYAGSMHDMAASENWIIFTLVPLAVAPMELLQAGHKHFAWDEKLPLTFGLLPRRNPKPGDVKWFTYKNAFYGHTGNAFDVEDGCVYLDAPLTYFNAFWFFPPIGEDMAHPSGKPPVDKLASHYVRWKFDPKSPSGPMPEPTELVNINGEMPRVDDRYVTRPYNTLFLAVHDPTGKNPALGGVYNAIARCDVNTGKFTSWCAGNAGLHEVAFVARSKDAPEGDGFLLTIANRYDVKLSSILILDTANIEAGPIAIVELPFRLRGGVHGSWVPAEEFAERKELCDMHGMTEEIRREFAGTTVVKPALLD